MNPTVDLTNCDREPIHIPGSIQPHGLLTACRGDALTLTQVSDNVTAFLGAAPGDVLGTPLAKWLAADSAAVIVDARAAGFPRERNPLSITLQTGQVYDAIAHRSGHHRRIRAAARSREGIRSPHARQRPPPAGCHQPAGTARDGGA
jgi:two-component system, chemotaxis family, sensor kinase Cph1